MHNVWALQSIRRSGKWLVEFQGAKIDFKVWLKISETVDQLRYFKWVSMSKFFNFFICFICVGKHNHGGYGFFINFMLTGSVQWNAVYILTLESSYFKTIFLNLVRLLHIALKTVKDLKYTMHLKEKHEPEKKWLAHLEHFFPQGRISYIEENVF